MIHWFRLEPLLTTSSPGKEAEEGSDGESSPCEPKEGSIRLGLSTPIDAVDVGVWSVFFVDTSVDDDVAGEVGAH